MTNDPVIQLTKVSKTYVSGHETLRVLQDVTFTGLRGETIAIRGKSGSGKSTLLNIIGGLDRADAGEVRIEALQISALSSSQIARFRRTHIGFVFQRFNLLSGLSAIENVIIPLRLNNVAPNAAIERATAALRRVGLSDRLGSKSSQLSAGEMQRVAIARAIAHEPTVLLADEPTGSLDPANAEIILNYLQDLAGAVSVLVTHDQSVADRCRTEYLLDQGRLERSR
ncbi:MAG TPA: ABC transporter ATP-binding protein [Bryobacteraceae bacterium]|nr:ABC transporter ATP-binding protein [Bryobacteraceae bacterium]